ECRADPYKDANGITNEEMADKQDCNVRNAEWNPDIGEVGMEEGPLSSFNVNVDPTMNSSSVAKWMSSTSSRKRKISDSANTCLGTLTRVLESEFGDPEYRAMIRQQVRDLEAFDGNENLMVANKLVKNPLEMELFLRFDKGFQGEDDAANACW
ncbi:UNVERIFIED_CONTAM: hypothetical protein Sindi_2684000, partial [Sesamum indicum]